MFEGPVSRSDGLDIAQDASCDDGKYGTNTLFSFHKSQFLSRILNLLFGNNVCVYVFS